MTLDDLILPTGPSPLTLRAAEIGHPDAGHVYALMEDTARHLALYHYTQRHHPDEAMHHRHAFRTALTQAEFAHIRITKGATLREQMISARDRVLIRRWALAITNLTASQEHHQ
jgi:hypothetical protein